MSNVIELKLNKNKLSANDILDLCKESGYDEVLVVGITRTDKGIRSQVSWSSIDSYIEKLGLLRLIEAEFLKP